MDKQADAFVLGIKGYFISNAWELESVMLGTYNRAMSRYTGENINIIWFKEVVSEFDIAQMVKHVVTDSGSNVIKMFVTLSGYENDQNDESERRRTKSLSL